jgi:3-hydroxybutyryl-CoA dehydrogenase
MKPKELSIGVVGLGLMGSSITTCFLIAGHTVVAVAPIEGEVQFASKRIKDHLSKSKKEGLIKDQPEKYLKRLTITMDYSLLRKCGLVVECTLEDVAIKRSVFEKIEAVIQAEAILTSNTSAIPISILQKLTQYPKRFFGLHWMEPSHTTRFLEIICGELSDVKRGEYLYEVAKGWGKEPTFLRKDIRGFITNRLMYALYREAFNLVENGYATVEDIDLSCRNVPGYWMTFCGPFRWMDLTGVQAYHAVMKDLFPTLSNSTKVPRLIDDIVRAGGKGISNARGFYDYTPEEAKLWEKTYKEFSYKIRDLALQYPSDLVQKKILKKKK